MLEPLWIFWAFILGFVAFRVGLPPLVGYLIAGFVLNAMGVDGGEVIDTLANLGVMLLLFSIGLKLKIKSLLKPEVWAGASAHMLATLVFFALVFRGLGVMGLPVFSNLDFKPAFLAAFALSFSSTVFAVKILETKGEMAALHGRTAIGILIMQDIFAVLFLSASTGKIPSPWALLVLPCLFILRPILLAVLERCGHRELLLLFAVFLSLGLGAAGFEMVGLKADLGALVLGILVAGHPKADELSKVLLSFKDLFLVGFFLSIGLAGLPDGRTFAITGLLIAALPFKIILFFLLLTRFRLRSRTALLTSFSLANYSEFGLVVGALGVQNGWLGADWLVVIAIALSISFILASPLNTAAHAIYTRRCKWLQRFETPERHPEDEPVDTGEAEIIIFGMGRVGAAAYDAMRARYADKVLGIDYDAEAVQNHLAAGRKVIQNDATDPDFWEAMRPAARVKLIMLAMASHAANVYAAKRFSQSDYAGMIAAIAHYDDQAAELEALGVSVVFNYYTEVGIGFADQVCEKFAECKIA
jgi:predicted Kef-type K+ transport protein